MSGYTVAKHSAPDEERVSTVGDARRYGHSLIEVRDPDGKVVAWYIRERGFRHASARAVIEGIAYLYPRNGHRTLRAWFIAEIAARYGVKT